MGALEELEAKLRRVEKEAPKMVMPKVEQAMKSILNKAINDYYAGYSPKAYGRTGNFADIASDPEIDIEDNSITMTVSSDQMHGYPGVIGQWLYNDDAFEMMYERGQHGDTNRGFDWLMATSVPPHMLVQSDLEEHGAQFQKWLQDAVNSIMG